MRYVLLLIIAGISLGFAACNRSEPPSAAPAAPATPGAPAAAPMPLSPMPSMTELNRGARLFQKNCAQCHGPQAQGHPDWQTPGIVAAPPLNGTGNDWKRSRAELVDVIMNGAKRNGVLVMPAWKGRLSKADVNDVITWFQALWPPDVYAHWQRANGAAAGG